jgi:translocation and assembly module TamA
MIRVYRKMLSGAFRRAWIGLFLLFGIFGAVSWAAEKVPAAYLVRMEGVQEDALRTALLELSQAKAAQGEAVSPLHLRRRAQRDLERFHTRLRSEGYYGAVAEFEVIEDPPPLTLLFRIDPGPRYRIGAVDVLWTDISDGPPAPSPEALGLTLNSPAEAKAVLDAESRLISMLTDEGYPLARAEEREVLVDHATQLMNVTYRVALVGKAAFGALQISGLETVKERVIQEKLPWEEGQPFEQKLIGQFQERLYRTELFSLIQVSVDGPIDEAGQAPIHLRVAESAHRTVRLGAQYYSDEGPGVFGSWEHRNLRGLGHRLRTSLQVTAIDITGEVLYTLAGFRREDQDLAASIRLSRLTPDAFDSTRLESEVWVTRRVSERLSVSPGIKMVLNQVDQDRESRRYWLFGAPLKITYDHSNDLLDPTRGYRIRSTHMPMIDFLREDVSFFKNEITFTHYLPFAEEDRYVLATRIHAGSIVGEGLSGIPADERFYAGGGGSIRGYEYQRVGPLNRRGNPIGGRSVLDVSSEFRARINDGFGMAVFVDGGSAFDATYPDFSETIRWAAGAGVRYFTPIGPFRLDVAIPVNRRSGDSAFQIYLGIGQAF